MREIRTSGSEGGGVESNRPSLPLSGRDRSSLVGLDSRCRAGLSGEKSSGGQGKELASPISSWPGLSRGPSAHRLDPWASTPLDGRGKDVDTRIKSAQDELKLFPPRPKLTFSRTALRFRRNDE